MKTTVILLVLLMAYTANAADVLFSAPMEMRGAIKEEILALRYTPVDVSAIDDALFNGKDSVKERAIRGELDFAPLPSLPLEVQADVRNGLVGCRTRLTRKPKAGTADCGAELAQTVWQRHLERTRPERVLEFKPAEPNKDGVAFLCATYRANDASLSVLGPHGPKLEPLVRKAVVAMLTKKLEPNGVRPTADMLPGEEPPPFADLKQGLVQSLPAVEVPAGCKLPPLVVDPQTVPLAQTMTALWKTTDARLAPVRCDLALSGRAGERPSSLAFSCGASVTALEIFPGTAFADSNFQADIARTLVRYQLAAFCAQKPARP